MIQILHDLTRLPLILKAVMLSRERGQNPAEIQQSSYNPRHEIQIKNRKKQNVPPPKRGGEWISTRMRDS